jgi:hypothetical protein
MRLGCIGLAMEVKMVLRLEKGTQTKERQMGMFGPADMFVQMRVIETG